MCYAAGKNAAVTGVDASPEMIRLCNEKKTDLDLKNVKFLQGNILSLDELSLPKANLVISSSLLEYLEDIDVALDILVSLLREDGMLVVSLPNKSSLFRKLEPVAYRLTGRPGYYKFVKNVRTLEDFSRRLTARGLEITDQAYFSETPLLSALFRKTGACEVFGQSFCSGGAAVPMTCVNPCIHTTATGSITMQNFSLMSILLN